MGRIGNFFNRLAGKACQIIGTQGSQDEDNRLWLAVLSLTFVGFVSVLAGFLIYFLLDRMVGCVPDKIWNGIHPKSKGISSTGCFWMSVIAGTYLFLRLLKKLIEFSFDEVPVVHKAILTLLGRRLRIVIGEGWHLFPLQDLLVYDKILISVAKVNQLIKAKVRTPDLVDLNADVGITFTPGGVNHANGKDDPQLFLTFLDNGGGSGVAQRLEAIVKSTLRIWGMSQVEGPSNWEEAAASKEDVAALLAKGILGDNVSTISSEDIPTEPLLRYFSVPRKPPLKTQEEKWGSRWEKLETRLNELGPEKQGEIQGAVEERLELISAISRGNAKFVNASLGITINQLTIGEVIPVGKMAEALEARTAEAQKRKAEMVDVVSMLDQAEVVQKRSNKRIPLESAINLVQIQEGKITRRDFGVPPSLMAGLKKIFK